MPIVTVSIVSHGHGPMLGLLLDDLVHFCEGNVEIVVTLNIPEEEPRALSACSIPVRVIRNTSPKGFAANHNQAVRAVTTDFYCVLNPDVRLHGNPFPRLVEQLTKFSGGAIAPKVVDSAGKVQDSARRFPTFASLLRKALQRGTSPDYIDQDNEVFAADWIAGMFMLFRSSVFRELGGFDERYFLYYEDVDLCARMANRGLAALIDPTVSIVHDPQRASWRVPRYAWHHLRSMMRYLSRRRVLLPPQTRESQL
jgi:N-acetylglucosaminyl-diphospho-decaprenol L-rhamnosyltransferase